MKIYKILKYLPHILKFQKNDWFAVFLQSSSYLVLQIRKRNCHKFYLVLTIFRWQNKFSDLYTSTLSVSLCKFIQIPTLTFFAIQMISLWIKKLNRLRFFFLYILQWTLTTNYPNIGTKEQIDYVSGFMIWTEKPRKIHTFTLTMLQILKLEPTMLLYISILMWEIK